MEITKKQFVFGSFWKLLESLGTKGISFLVTLVLARILSPAEYGLVAIATVFISLSEILVQSGLSTALIQKNKIEESDYSTVFFFSMAIATVLYVAIWFSSDLIADFYAEPGLIPVLRVLCLSFFFQAFASIRIAKVSREFLFRPLAKCNVISSAISGVLGIFLALVGFGVWALVAQQLCFQLILNLLLVTVIHWHPMKPDFSRLGQLMPFGITVLTSSFINYLSDSGFDLAIGKMYSVESLGFYSKGGQIPRQFSLYTVNALTSVMLPTFSSKQNDPLRFAKVIKKSITAVGYFIFPLMSFCVAAAPQVIVVLFGNQWIPSVPIFRAFCLYYAATPIMLTCVQVYLSLGKGVYRIRTEALRLCLTVLLLLFASLGTQTIAELSLGKAIVEIVIAIVSLCLVARLIQSSSMDLFACLAFPFFSSAAILLLCYLASLFVPSGLGLLLAQIVLALLAYLILSFIFKPDTFCELITLAKQTSKVRKNE